MWFQATFTLFTSLNTSIFVFVFISFPKTWLFFFGLSYSIHAGIKANRHLSFRFSLYLTIKVNGSLLWQIPLDRMHKMKIGYLVFLIQTAGILTGIYCDHFEIARMFLINIKFNWLNFVFFFNFQLLKDKMRKLVQKFNCFVPFLAVLIFKIL